MRPSGQGRVAPGRWAKKPAIHTIQEQAASAGQAMTVAAAGQAGRISAASSPLMVATTAAGSLSRLAATDQAPTEGWRRMRSGPQAAWATSGRATAAANHLGRRRERQTATGLEPMTIPAVATTDRANP